MSLFSAIGDFLGGAGGTILGIGADLLGAGMESSAARDAANTQANAADRAVAEQQRQFDITRSDMSPWMASGQNALKKLDSLLGTGGPGSARYSSAVSNYQTTISRYQAAQAEYAGLWKQKSSPARDQRIAQLGGEIASLNSQAQQYLNEANASLKEPADPNSGWLLKNFGLQDFQADPGYQFRLGEGSKAIENSAAARGMQLSGANLKALNRFNQDFASNEFSNAYNRDSLNKQRTFNFLTGQSGGGQTTATNLGQLGAQTSGNVADTYLQAANARAAGQVGSTNAWTNSLRNVSDYYRMRSLLGGAK